MDTPISILFFFVAWLPIALLFHEFGHYVLAKRRGNYKGWGIKPAPHVKLTVHFPGRYDYLSGIIPSIPSIIILPLFGESFSWLFACLAGCIILGLSDLTIFSLFNKIKRSSRWGIATPKINEFWIRILPKAVGLFFVFDAVLGIIFIKILPPVDPYLVTTLIGMISVLAALKATNLLSKLHEIVKLFD